MNLCPKCKKYQAIVAWGETGLCRPCYEENLENMIERCNQVAFDYGCTVANAMMFATRTGYSARFNSTHLLDEHGHYGEAYPCGCIALSTVMSDGSIGIGGWDDKCLEHSFD